MDAAWVVAVIAIITLLTKGVWHLSKMHTDFGSVKEDVHELRIEVKGDKTAIPPTKSIRVIQDEHGQRLKNGSDKMEHMVKAIEDTSIQLREYQRAQEEHIEDCDENREDLTKRVMDMEEVLYHEDRVVRRRQNAPTETMEDES